MSQTIFYICDVTLCRENFFLLWYSDEVNGVYRSPSGTSAKFESITMIRRVAEKRSLVVMDEVPAKFNYDELSNLLESQETSMLNISSLLDMWNFISDIFPKNNWSVGLVECEHGLSDLYTKLFRSSNIIPISPQWNSPQWDDDDWQKLAHFFDLASQEMCLFWSAIPYEQDEP